MFLLFLLMRECCYWWCYWSVVIPEKVLLLHKINEMKTLMDLHVLRFRQQKNNIFNGQSLCVCVCVSVIIIKPSSRQPKTRKWIKNRKSKTFTKPVFSSIYIEESKNDMVWYFWYDIWYALCYTLCFYIIMYVTVRWITFHQKKTNMMWPLENFYLHNGTIE